MEIEDSARLAYVNRQRSLERRERLLAQRVDHGTNGGRWDKIDPNSNSRQLQRLVDRMELVRRHIQLDDRGVWNEEVKLDALN